MTPAEEMSAAADRLDPAPATGQVWQDCDPRSPGRYLLITALDTTHATVRQVAYNPARRITADLPAARTTRIRLDRFHPRNYRHVTTLEPR